MRFLLDNADEDNHDDAQNFIEDVPEFLEDGNPEVASQEPFRTPPAPRPTFSSGYGKYFKQDLLMAKTQKIKKLQDHLRYYKKKSNRKDSKTDLVSIVNNCSQFTPEMKSFLSLQIKRAESPKSSRAHYTSKEQDQALRFYYTIGRKGYLALKTFGFLLPVPRTLCYWLQHIVFRPGVNSDRKSTRLNSSHV